MALLDEYVRWRPDPSGTVRWFTPDGAERSFSLPAPGASVAGDTGRLWRSAEADGAFEIREPDGTVRRFEPLTGCGSDLRLTKLSRPGATPITVAWEHSVQAGGGMTCRPLEMTLWSCDDDASSNPQGATDCAAGGRKAELGSIALTTTGATLYWRLTEARVSVAGRSPVRRLLYGYHGASDMFSYYLTTVQLACDGCDGAPQEQVARYEYGLSSWSPPGRAAPNISQPTSCGYAT